MTDYLPIANSEVDANSPITETLMTRMRDNPIAQFERAPGAPAWGATVDVAGSNASGYYRIWSDGFIEQWGRTANVSSATVTFPVAYSTTVGLEVLATYTSGAAGAGSLVTTNYTTTQFFIEAAGVRVMSWRATGY